jgi:hypothetical protein
VAGRKAGVAKPKAGGSMSTRGACSKVEILKIVLASDKATDLYRILSIVNRRSGRLCVTDKDIWS